MDYEEGAVKGFTLIGFDREFPAEDSYTTVPKFWDEISGRYLDRLWGGKTPETPQEKAVMEHGIGEFGVCIDGADDGKFRYLIAGAYKGGNVPDGMTTFDVPGGDWAKFRAVGPLPGSLQAVNTRVFKEWLPGNPDWEAAGQCNIEWYSNGDPNSPGYQSEIWLPVRRRT